MPYTIQGQILSEVWLEFSIDGGATWTRLPNTFPAGTSIVTSDLPRADLKVRLVAVCDETTISNVLDYDLPENSFSHSGQFGTITCVDGQTGFNSLGTITLFSSSSTLENGVELFEDELLTIPTTIDDFKKGTDIFDLNNGIIDIVTSINAPC